MPKFKKEAWELENQLDKWFYVLKNLWKLESRPKILEEGLKKGKIQVAQALKRQDTSNEVIVQLTGLSISEIEVLAT